MFVNGDGTVTFILYFPCRADHIAGIVGWMIMKACAELAPGLLLGEIWPRKSNRKLDYRFLRMILKYRDKFQLKIMKQCKFDVSDRFKSVMEL